jgi:hypothetical protein
MKTGRPTAILALCASLATGMACGDDSSASPEEFRSQANRVCRDVERQLDEIQKTLPVTAEQAEKQAEALVDVSEQALSNLRKIETPEELEGAYDRYLAEREKAIGHIEQARDAANAKDSGAYERAKRRLAAGQPVRRQLALRLGLGSCSRPSLPPG